MKLPTPSTLPPAAPARPLGRYIGRALLLLLVGLFALGLTVATQAAPAPDQAGATARLGMLAPALPTGVPSAVPTLPGPVPTATPCIVVFADVPTTHPMYSYVRCLVCLGVISG